MAKIPYTWLNPVSDGVLAGNRAYSRGLGLPEVGDRPVAARLAVVGGGPSAVHHVNTLFNWDGDIWAINGMWRWLRNWGKEATFYAIDPTELILDMVEGVERAVLGDTVCPAVFDAIPNVTLARLGEDDIAHWTTAAATAPVIAAYAGYERVHLFGCDSSFDGPTHVYKDDRPKRSLFDVKCGGKIYETTPQMIAQAEFLAEFARELPDFLKIEGDGFLPALVEHGDYDVVAIPRHLAERLEAVNA